MLCLFRLYPQLKPLALSQITFLVLVLHVKHSFVFSSWEESAELNLERVFFFITFYLLCHENHVYVLWPECNYIASVCPNRSWRTEPNHKSVIISPLFLPGMPVCSTII